MPLYFYIFANRPCSQHTHYPFHALLLHIELLSSLSSSPSNHNFPSSSSLSIHSSFIYCICFAIQSLLILYIKPTSQYVLSPLTNSFFLFNPHSFRTRLFLPQSFLVLPPHFLNSFSLY